MKDWRDFTLGEISDEIDEMVRLNEAGTPKELYSRAKQALEQLKSLSNLSSL